jgi:hypothetical protein
MAGVVWSWEFNRNRPEPPQPEPFAPPPPIPDEFWQRLLKAVPVTAVSFVTAATPFALAGTGTLETVLLGAVFSAGLVFAFGEMIGLRRAGRLEIMVAVIAYLVWTYAQGGIFEAFHWFQPLVAGIVAIAFAVALQFVPAIKPATS